MSSGHCRKRRRLVMHVVHSVEPGGTERVLCRLVRALRGDQMDHLVCGLRDPRPFGGVLGDDVNVLSLRAGQRDRLCFHRLATAIRRHGVDIVHARNWGTWTDAALAVTLVPATKLILGFHGLQNGASFTAGQRRRARWLRLHKRPATTVSEAARDMLVRELRFRPDGIRTITNGVDLERFTPADDARRARARARLGLSNDVFVVGTVANFFESVKGQPLLVDAFACLAAADHRARLVLVGYGPLEASVRAYVRDNGLGDRVVFTGRLEDVHDVLPGFDLFVCSSYSEGMSNAVLEAMATALPCLVTDVSDHRRIFAGIGDDLVVPPGDSRIMAQRLISLARSPGRFASIGRRARRVVEQQYGFERTVSEYRRLYREALSAPPALRRQVAQPVTPATCPWER